MTQEFKQNQASTPVNTALGATQIIAKLAQLEGWQLHGDGAEVAIEKTYRFDSYALALAFTNAVAFIAQRRDHHPDLLLRPRACSVRFRSHDAQGISQQDFACAAQVDALLASD